MGKFLGGEKFGEPYSKDGPIPILLVPSTELKILPISIPIPISIHIALYTVACISHQMSYLPLGIQ